MNELSEFEKALEWLKEEEARQASVPPRNQWRAYYIGNKIMRCANGPEWPDNEENEQWIDITSDQARNIHSYYVDDAKLIKIDRRNSNVVKLTKDSAGQYTSAADNMSLLIEPNEQLPATEQYAKNTGRHS
jgi:hypothetical protein